jgi:HEAT repeat protein
MILVSPIVLGLALLLGAEAPPTHTPDSARLRELLYNTQHPRSQSQAALLLVQDASTDAATTVRQGLRQTNSPEVFMALAAAVRLSRDTRFNEDLLDALAGGVPAVRHSAALALAVLADNRVIVRLQALAEDGRADPAIRQAAVWALGRSGRREAAVVLLDQLSSDNETLREAAADSLAELTGQSYELDVARWRAWWEQHKGLSNERWLEERLAYLASRNHRLESELDRARSQVVRLHQELYGRLPAGDRLTHVLSLAEAVDPAVRGLAVSWGLELLPSADAVGQRSLVDLLFRLSHDGSGEVQGAAVLALGRVSDARVYDRLRLLLQRGSAPVRAAAVRALAQQVQGPGPEALARQRQVVAALQKALDDPALPVVVEAAEGLGTLGVPEAGPVLTVLLHHASPSVRQTAALALERVADQAVLEGVLAALEDPVASVRFSLVGALAHAAGDGRTLTEPRRTRLLGRLEELLLRDPDPGVRSRAATVLGQCGSPAVLALLWRRVRASEDSRVQDKAWAAFVELLSRSGNSDLLQEWSRTLGDAQQPARRLQLLTEVTTSWQKRSELRTAMTSAQELLVPVQLEQGRWAAAFPVVHELLGRSGAEADLDRRLQWLLTIGRLAQKDGNRSDTLRAVQEAQPYLGRRPNWAGDFEKLEKQARQP